MWRWNQAAHERLHLPVVSSSAVLWNLLSSLSSGSSDAMTRWQGYQQLRTFFPILDSENLNLEEARNTEAGKAMVTLPHVYPWFRVRHTALSWKRTWRKARTSSRKVKQLVSENKTVERSKAPKNSRAEKNRPQGKENLLLTKPGEKNERKCGTELRQQNNPQAALLEALGSQPSGTSAWDAGG